MKIDKFFLLYLGACILYSLSLCLPVLAEEQNAILHGPIIGYEILLLGWVGIYSGIYEWIANVFFILGLIFSLFKGYSFGIFYSIGAILTGLQTLILDWQFSYAETKADFYFSLHDLMIGFYVWELSFIFLFTYCFTKLLSKKSEVKSSRQKYLPKWKV